MLDFSGHNILMGISQGDPVAAEVVAEILLNTAPAISFMWMAREGIVGAVVAEFGNGRPAEQIAEAIVSLSRSGMSIRSDGSV
jgi:hypothetical protein